MSRVLCTTSVKKSETKQLNINIEKFRLPNFTEVLFMANNFITDQIIAKTALMRLKNKLTLTKTVDRQYQNTFSGGASPTGETIRIRKPVYLQSSDGPLFSEQNIQQKSVNLTINQRKKVCVALTTAELTLNLNSFTESVIDPAMAILANDVDSFLYDKAVNQFYNYTGTAGTAPNSMVPVLNIGAKLSALGVPMENRFAMMSENDGAILKSGVSNLFNENFNSKIILDAKMGRLNNFDMYTAQNVVMPTAASTVFGTPLINGAGQSGTTLTIDGVTSGMTIYAGCVFQITGVYAVNPVTRRSTTQLANFVVLNDATAVSTSITITISCGSGNEGIILTGPYQNVTNAPADNAAVTFQPTHTKNIFYHKQAFTLAMINLYAPTKGVQYSANLVDKDAGISMRYIRQYDIKTDQDLARFDIYFGGDVFGEYGGIVMGSNGV